MENHNLDSKILISETIYGRSTESAVLQDAFRWAALGTTELVLISGPAGVGKTSLVMEAFKPTIAKSGIFVWGKFEPYSKGKPYEVFIKCLQFLVQKLLTESEPVLDQWKDKLSKALGSQAAVLTDLIPEAIMLFHTTAPVEALPAKENQNRFERVFRRFVQTIAGYRSPLVLFFDDIHWSDRATLQLLHSLVVDPEIEHLCIIGAYRDEEWLDNQDIQERWLVGTPTGFSVRYIQLEHMKLQDVQHLIADTLVIGIDVSFSLAHALYVKSVGNPLYLKQLLQAAMNEGMIYYDKHSQRWLWDLQKLQQFPSIEGQSEHLISLIHKLEPATQRLLVYASTLGGKFSSQLLSVISEQEYIEVISSLLGAVQMGLLSIVHSSSSEAFVSYQFTHDRIHQAAYTLLETEERKRVHRDAAAYMLSIDDQPADHEQLFELVHHLNVASELLSADLLEQTVELNVRAAHITMQTSDYETALKHFTHAILHMPLRYWADRQEYAFQLVLLQCECAYLCGRFEQAEQLLDDLLKRAQDWMQTAQVIQLKIKQYSNTGQYAKAIELGISIFSEVGIQVPSELTPSAVKQEITQTRELLFEQHVSILNDASQHDASQIKLMSELLVAFTGPAFFSNRNVLAVLSAQLLRYIYRCGGSQGYPTVHVIFGIVLTTVLGDFTGGYRVGEYAVRLAEQSGQKSLLTRTKILFHTVIAPWMRVDRQDTKRLWDAAQYSIETGDYVYSSYAIGGLINTSYGMHTLTERDKLLRQSLQVSEMTKEELVWMNILIYRQLTDQLQSAHGDQFHVSYENMNEQQFLDALHQMEGGAVTLYQIHTYKAQLHYWFGRYEQALHHAELATPYEASAVQAPHMYIHRFYETLALAALVRMKPDRSDWRSRLQQRYQQYRQWSLMSPEHFGNRFLLLKLEAEYKPGSHLDLAQYDEVIDRAKLQEDYECWFIASECAASIYQKLGRERAAKGYWLEAYEAYEQFGMEAKCAKLRSAFVELFQTKTFAKLDQPLNASEATKEPIMKKPEPQQSWQQFNEETFKLPKDKSLAETRDHLIRQILQDSGADRGCLIVERGQELYVDQWLLRDKESIIASEPVEHSEKVPRSLIQYAFRLRKLIFIDNINSNELFKDDPYFVSRQQSAIVCLPLFVQNVIAGLLYLEFSPHLDSSVQQKTDMLMLLATQLLFMMRLSETLRVSSKVMAAEAESDPDSDWRMIDMLTEREYEVLSLMSAGLSNNEISMRLGVALGTVKVHIHNIFSKLNVSRRTQAVAEARRMRLLDSPNV